MKNNFQIANISKKLRYAAFIAIFVALILLFLCVHAWLSWQEPIEGITITFQMYKSKVALIKILLLRLIPAIAICFMSFGFLVLNYLRKLASFEKEMNSTHQP